MDTPTKLCQMCNREFPKAYTTSRAVWEKQKYCSASCRAKAVGLSKVGTKQTEEANAKRSRAMTGEKNHRYGTKQSQETIAKRVKAFAGKTTNERHWNWKGDEAGYLALHEWMNRHYPRTGTCEHCGKSKQKTDYANIRGHQYSRVREDYAELCRSCHYHFDNDTTES
jgi:hypothetical protein